MGSVQNIKIMRECDKELEDTRRIKRMDAAEKRKILAKRKEIWLFYHDSSLIALGRNTSKLNTKLNIDMKKTELDACKFMGFQHSFWIYIAILLWNENDLDLFHRFALQGKIAQAGIKLLFTPFNRLLQQLINFNSNSTRLNEVERRNKKNTVSNLLKSVYIFEIGKLGTTATNQRYECRKESGQLLEREMRWERLKSIVWIRINWFARTFSSTMVELCKSWRPKVASCWKEGV